jgi:CHASE2 domain-containing sensor protein
MNSQLGSIERMEYSSTIEFVLFGLWAVGSLLLAWFVRRRLYAYLGSVGLSAPAIAYSMVGYGMLPMGGILHALLAGVYALPFHYFFQRFRLHKQKTESR